MARISKVRNDLLKMDYGWVLDIRDDEELKEWQDQVRSSGLRAEFRDAVSHGDHARTPGGCAIAILSEIKGIGIAFAAIDLEGERIMGMRNQIHRSGAVFVNTNSGYFGNCKGLVIEETREVPFWSFESVTFTEKDIRTIKWPGGKHWYAKIGDIDVVVDGDQKWNTKAAAQKAAERFLKDI